MKIYRNFYPLYILLAIGKQKQQKKQKCMKRVVKVKSSKSLRKSIKNC